MTESFVGAHMTYNKRSWFICDIVIDPTIIGVAFIVKGLIYISRLAIGGVVKDQIMSGGVKLEQSHIKSPIIDYIYMPEVPKWIEKVNDVGVVT